MVLMRVSKDKSGFLETAAFLGAQDEMGSCPNLLTIDDKHSDRKIDNSLESTRRLHFISVMGSKSRCFTII